MWIKEKDIYFKRLDNKLLLLRKKTIKTGKSKVRHVFIPNPETKTHFKSMLIDLNNIHKQNSDVDVVHGFVECKSPITNANRHKGFQNSINLDIKNFFEAIRPAQVNKYVSKEVIDTCFIENVLPQGVPTSPIISNIACINLDKTILQHMKSMTVKSEMSSFCYTRYADDITISFNIANCNYTNEVIKRLNRKIALEIRLILKTYGFDLNRWKTQFQSSQHNNVIVTGVAISSSSDFSELLPTRSTKRKLRAAIHQKNYDSALGIINWIENIRMNYWL